MNSRSEHTICRRELIRAVARGAGLAGLAALAGAVTARGPGARNAQTCTGAGICRRCGALAGCALPEALSAKRETKRP